MPPEHSTPQTHTVTLEMQGIAPDLAAHRRSVYAQLACDHVSLVDRWDPTHGRHKEIKVKTCRLTACSLVGRRSFCLEHRS